jgi:hypothetical protein
MPEICAFDDALANEFPKLFDFMEDADCYTTDSFGFLPSEYKMVADWFGPLQASLPYKPQHTFGGLDPKRPEYCPVPTGAVFGWGEHDSSGLSPLLSSWGSFGPDEFGELDMDFKGMEEKKESKIPEAPLPHHLPKELKEKEEKKEKREKKEKKLAIKLHKETYLTEKKRRGRPRLEISQPPALEALNIFNVPWDSCNLSARALTDRPSDLYNFREDELVTQGCYSKAMRRLKIERFKAKKLRLQHFGPFVRYGFRKQFAGSRPRVGGRFIKMGHSPVDDSHVPANSQAQPLEPAASFGSPLFEQEDYSLFNPEPPDIQAYPSVG